jgi:hypothetical protein
VSFGVMARNAGTTASGSTITNSELAASKMYSNSLIKSNQTRMMVKVNSVLSIGME